MTRDTNDGGGQRPRAPQPNTDRPAEPAEAAGWPPEETERAREQEEPPKPHGDPLRRAVDN